MQRSGITAINDSNALRQKAVGYPEIASRMASNEFAFTT